MNPSRILKEAEKFNFDSITRMSELDIPQFIEKHRDFINTHSFGFGLYIWKPKVILQKLISIDDNDVLVYCDAGIHLNSNGINRYIEYLDIIKNKDMISFSTNDSYFAQQWVKRDVIDLYYPQFANGKNRCCYAGLLMIKKTKNTINLIQEWLKLCERYEFIDRSPSSLSEYPNFIGQDTDNGLFNICLAKHGISHYIYPDETNIYLPNGQQNYLGTIEEWKVLDKFPFQCRRLRPGNKYYEN
jgi:hypothetical protein